MALITSAATIAATAAGAMYLDGRCAIRKDIRDIAQEIYLSKSFVKTVKNKRVSLYYFFEESVNHRSNDECVWSREGCFTWAQANEKVNQYAQWYLSRGVQPHDLVSFYLTNSPDFIFAWLGLWAIGAAPAMINYNLAGKALIHCLKVAGSRLIIVDDIPELVGRVEVVRGEIEGTLGATICTLDASTKSAIGSEKAERPGDSYRKDVRGNSPMAIFYTSGTTGMPKGVPFNHDRGFLQGALRGNKNRIIVSDDRWYNCMPMYHGTGGVAAVWMMMIGITLCIGKRFSTSRFWGEVRDSRATWITYVGETARYLLAAPPSPLDKDHYVRAMYGNGLRPDVWIKFRERFGVPEVVEFFNSSEGVFGLVNFCRGDYLAGSVGFHGAIKRYRTRNTLVPVLIDQATGAIARDPETGFAYRQPYEKGGEMLVAVPNVTTFAGYHRNPEATMKKFEKDVFKKGDLWYRSGDALRRTADGRWFFLDRLGDTFRWKGENVSTVLEIYTDSDSAEVAEVLGRYQGVVEANVYGVALPNHDGRAGCAAIFIHPTHRPAFNFAGLLQYAREHLPRYAVPVFIRVVKEMTPIHNNKQNKVPLREEGVDPAKVHPEDQLLWVDGHGKGDTYVNFHRDHWEDLRLYSRL